MTKRREPYAKAYASWWRHPRTGPLTLAASGLEARIWSWSVDAGTDGFISKELVAQAAGPNAGRALAPAIVELVARGVLVDRGDQWEVREFLDANISKEADEARRANAVTRQDRSRGAPVTRDKDAVSRVTKAPTADSVTRDRSVSHTRSLDHDHDHDHDHDQDQEKNTGTSPKLVTRGRAPAPVPPVLMSYADLGVPEAEPTPLGRLLASFKRRWEAKTLPNGQRLGAGWTGVGQHRGLADTIAGLYASDPDGLEASLDGYFASSDPFPAKVRWNFKGWANDPGRWVGTKTEPAVDTKEIWNRIPQIGASAEKAST